MATQTIPQTTAHEPGHAAPTRSPWAPALAGGALLLAYLPLVAGHLAQIWLRPHYQFFPFAVLGAVVLFLLRLKGADRSRLVPAGPGPVLAVLGFGWLLLLGAEGLYSSWLGYVSFLVTLAGVLLAVGGPYLLKVSAPALVMLCLLVPPPFELDRNLILSLRTLTTLWSSRVLDYLGVFHAVAGNVVEVNGHRLLVEDACSGVNSLFSTLACTVFLIFYFRRPVLQSALLLLSAVGWVLLANVARVTLIAYAQDRWGTDLSSGWRHEALGLGLFALALLMIWSTDRLFLFLLKPGPRPDAAPAPVPEPSGESRPARPSAPFGRLRVSPWPVAAAFLALFAFHAASYGFAPEVNWGGTGAALARTADIGEDTLPEELGGWKRQAYEESSRNPGSAFGEYSKTWTYTDGRNQAVVSLDYPFPGWHDLSRCYTSQGWVVAGEAARPAGPDGPELGHVELALHQPGYRYGYLLYAQFDDQGKTLEPRLGAANLSVRRHRSALAGWLGGDGVEADPPPPVYQFQVFVTGYRPLGRGETARAAGLFLAQAKQLLEGHWPAAAAE